MSTTSLSSMSDIDDPLIGFFDEPNFTEKEVDCDFRFFDIDFDFNLFGDSKKKAVVFREPLEEVKTFYRGHRIDCDCFIKQKECNEAKKKREKNRLLKRCLELSEEEKDLKDKEDFFKKIKKEIASKKKNLKRQRDELQVEICSFIRQRKTKKEKL